MSFEYGYKWLNDRDSIVRLIEDLIGEQEDLRKRVVTLDTEQLLFDEGDYLEDLYVLLEGKIELHKSDVYDGEQVNLVTDLLMPGSFVGLIAFTTGNRTMTGARVVETSRAICIKREEFDDYLHKHHQLSYPMQQLMIANLIDRYQQNTALQVRMERLNRRLTTERNELQKAYRDLEETQNLLIHKEKMATLGQLVAGFAHEINNPVSSLLRSSELVIEQLQVLLESDHQVDELGWQLFEAGLNAKPLDTDRVRKRMEELKIEFAGVSRSLRRKLAQLPVDILPRIRDWENKNIDQLLVWFEAGKLLQNIRHSSSRIGNLVKSLKNYSRPDGNSYELLDVREGIEDTVLMLSNRLKFHEVVLKLNDIPETCGNMAELNQVWTNLICNACEAMEEKGQFTISCWEKDKYILIAFRDSGPGVPADIQDKIFEPNFTTKNQSKKFGLGLGLAISSEIIQKHNGTISVRNAPDGGAIFTVSLPLNTDCS